jgi:hypothetical protein
MGFLDKLKSLFSSQAGQDPMALWLYVKCKRCGTPVAVRVNLRNDPSLDEDGNGYILRKEIMDDKCFALMRAEISFDLQRKIVDKTIEKGEFITAEEYNAAKK